MRTLTLLIILAASSMAADIEVVVRNDGGQVVSATTITATNDVLAALDTARRDSKEVLQCDALPAHPLPNQYGCVGDDLLQYNGSWVIVGVYDGLTPVERFPTSAAWLHFVIRQALRQALDSVPTPAMQAYTDTIAAAEAARKSERDSGVQ
jgi:hypothetical protein